jgi:hypothetical protein
MNKETALNILIEWQKWCRECPPYDGDTPQTHRSMPFSPRELGIALDIAIDNLKIHINDGGKRTPKATA